MGKREKVLDLRAKADVEEYMTDHLATVRKMFAEYGELTPVAMIFAMVHPETRERLPHPGVVMVANATEFNPANKELFAHVVRGASAKLGAVGIVFTSETWTVGGAIGEPEQGAYERYLAWREQHPTVSMGEYPEVIEAAWVLLQHKTLGVRAWFAPVERPEGQPPALGEFHELPDFDHTEGIFARLLPSDWMS